MPPIAFDQVPADALVPFAYVEFDSEGAQQGAAIQSYRGLLIGSLAAGAASPFNATAALASEQDAADAFARARCCT